MNPYETFGSPTDTGRPDSRYDRDDDSFVRPPVDSYRRRSPGGQDRRRNRGRSRSPVAIDRYQPGDRGSRDDYYGASREHANRDREDRRRAPSPVAANIDRYVPGQETPQPQVKVNPLPNPLTLEFQVGFNWFAEWWRIDRSIKEEKERSKHGGRRPSDRVKGEKEAREEREKERAQIQVAYDNYKTELQVKMARSFVQAHKGEEWFKERYVAEVRDPVRASLADFRRGGYSQWEKDLEGGLFDEFTLEGIYKSESDGAGGVVEKEEGETTAVAEVLGVLDLLPAKGGDLRDDSIMQPALLIKTLAPNVSRNNVIDFCKEHLGDGDGGFKWLSLSDPNPTKKYHRIGWIMLSPEPEAMEEVERGDGRDEEGEDVENGVMNGGTTKSTAEKAKELINEKTIFDPTRGDFVCHVGVHNPPSTLRKKALWDLFSAPERVERDLELARRIVEKFDEDLGSGVNGLYKIEERVEDLRGKGWLQPPVTGPVKVKKKKSSFEDNDDMVLLEEGEEEGEEDEGLYDEEIDDEELLIKKKKLDLAVEYLRRVYNFCFFCVFESDSVHELARKCPGGHLRRPRTGLSSMAKAAAKASVLGQPFPSKKKEPFEEGEEESSPIEEKKPRSKNDQQLLRAFNWVKTFEDKLLQILEPESVDLKKIGGKPVEEALEEELKKYVKQEDESKFRCKVPECTKLFKAEHFWRKHVEKRHEEWFQGIVNDLNLVNSYVLDPSHIAPSRSDANSNGHFPMNASHMPTGTPRGFQLNNMPFFNNMGQGFNGGPMAQPGFGQPFMAHHNMQNSMIGGMQAGIVGADGNPMMGGMMHNPGVMRRGGNRHNNRTGPYDRRGQQGFGRNGMSGAGGMGLGGGPGGMRMASGGFMGQGMGGGGKWGDGAGGGMTMGPREAVQGRSIKSYEDLDAVGGEGAGELNY